MNANACNASQSMLHVVGVTEGCVNVLLLSACNQFPQSLQLLCTTHANGTAGYTHSSQFSDRSWVLDSVLAVWYFHWIWGKWVKERIEEERFQYFFYVIQQVRQQSLTYFKVWFKKKNLCCKGTDRWDQIAKSAHNTCIASSPGLKIWRPGNKAKHMQRLNYKLF